MFKTKKVLSLMLVFMMCFCMVPNMAFAGSNETHENQVHVIVENTTFTSAEDSDSGDEEPAWSGTLVDTWVDIDDESTMMTSVVAALDTVEAEQTGAESNYISEINGLAEFNGSSEAGWMGTLNDWFTNEGFAGFTVENGKLEAGDEIRIMFTLHGYGEDLGGSWANNDKTVKAVTFSSGTLDKEFSKDVHSYTLTLPEETTSVQITPTASNKNFLVKNFLNTDDEKNEYKRTAYVPVENGDSIIVKCGDPSWPSMNNQAGGTASNTPAETYTFKVAIEGQDVKEDEPEGVEGGLSALRIYTGSTSSQMESTTIFKDDFKTDTLNYTLAEGTDKALQLRFALETVEENAAVKVKLGESGSEKTLKAVDVDTHTSTNWINLTAGINKIYITVTPSDEEKQSVVYTFTRNMMPTLSSLSISGGEANVYMDKAFSSLEKEYTATVLESEKTLDINAVGTKTDYKVTVNGEENSSVNIESADSVKVAVSVGEDENKLTSEYKINLNKVGSYKAVFSADPGDTAIAVYDCNGERITLDSEGKAANLTAGTTEYSYVATKYGYITQSGSFSSEDGSDLNLKINMVKADENKLPQYTGEWTNFRGNENNMGVTDAAPAKNVSEAALKWAVKYGTGWSAAPTPPIIVNDNLYIAVAKKILKIDKETGEKLAESEDMVGNVGFALNPITYGEGMLFVPVGNGQVQALRADTLESLWVSEKIGGQTLCPITYHNGYIYGGTWNSEVKDGVYYGIAVTDEDPSNTTEEKKCAWKITKLGGFYWAGAYAT
ncbi:MAG: cadherin-like beta sandwich domain-containing protein, partial [Anaerovoracaceae bacterium]